jgi:hypothetical protein
MSRLQTDAIIIYVMDSNTDQKSYCVIFQLEQGAGMGRVAMCVPGLIKLVERWSGKNMEQLFRSSDGQLFGYLFKSQKPLAMMRSEFEGSLSTQNKDTFIIFEVGKNHSKVGFGQAAFWIERS